MHVDPRMTLTGDLLQNLFDLGVRFKIESVQGDNPGLYAYLGPGPNYLDHQCFQDIHELAQWLYRTSVELNLF